jgi:hypothetical protein
MLGSDEAGALDAFFVSAALFTKQFPNSRS